VSKSDRLGRHVNGHLSSEIVIGEATLATEYSFRNVLRFILIMTVNLKKIKKRKKKTQN